MNKNWIITTLLLYLAALSAFGYLLLNRKSSETPTIITELESAEVPTPKSALQPPKRDYSYITKNDLFNPLRGKAPDDENRPVAKKSGPPSRYKFDLRGVFRSGDSYGAIILVSGNNPASKEDLKKANGEIFFQGAEIAEGCVLRKVDYTSVTILQNGEEIVVKLEKLQPPEKKGEPDKPQPQDKKAEPEKLKPPEMKVERKPEDRKKDDTPRRPQ